MRTNVIIALALLAGVLAYLWAGGSLGSLGGQGRGRPYG